MEQNTRKKSPVVRFLVLGGLGLLVLLGLILYWQKDRLIGAVVSQVNERLNTRVDVGSVDVTLLRTFPRLAVGFERVTVFESCCGKKDTLARIQHVQFYLSVWKALGGTYQIEGLAVKKGFVRLRQMANGTVNYDIFKKDTAVARSAPSGKKPVPFQLEKTHLEQIEFRYQKEGSFMVSQFIDKIEADYMLLAGRSTLAAKGKVLVHKLSTASQTLMQKMPMGIDVTLALAPTKAGTELTLTNALIDMDGAAFRLNGKVLAAEKPLYNVQLTAEKSDLKTLAAFMPPTARQALAAYKSSGRINLTLTAEKKNPDTKYPRLDVAAQAQSAGFRHNRLPLTFAGVAFRGSFTLPAGGSRL